MTKIDRKSLRVLIADDEVEFASAIVARLKLRSYVASMATSGKDALAAIEQERPDVLLLDLKMPDLDGLEVLASLRKSYPDLAVIILTGHGSFEAGQKGIDLGAYDYIMKPVDLNLLISKIEDAFQWTSAKKQS